MSWTRYFRRAASSGGPRLSDVMGGLATLFEGMGEEEVYLVMCREVRRIFHCNEVSLYLHAPGAAARQDGEWLLRPVGRGDAGPPVTQSDLDTAHQAVPGAVVPADEALRTVLLRKAVALAFEEGEFYGCDIEDGQAVLLRDPGPEHDLGSGDLTRLAIPLVYRHQVGGWVEEARVGVVCLDQVSVGSDLRPLERFLRTLLGYAITTPACSLRDPITNLYTPLHLREQVAAYLNMRELTKGKLKGGLVVGHIDALCLRRQHLHAAGAVPPTGVEQRIAEVRRGVGACLQRLATQDALPGADYRCGVAARLGRDGFAVLLPLLEPQQLVQWAGRLGRAVREQRFSGPAGSEQVLVRLRVIPFGLPGTERVDGAWSQTGQCLEAMRSAPPRPRTSPEPAPDLLCLSRNGWESPRPGGPAPGTQS